MSYGIALGGGGARGYAHIGVLQVLAENKLLPTCAAGTSMGALIGATYAADKLNELVEVLDSISLADIPALLSPTFSKQGMFSGKRILGLIEKVIDAPDFADLKLPFAAVAVDLTSGTSKTFTSGDLALALRSSFAIPGVFTPVVSGDELYVDGGLLEPIPIEAVQSLAIEQVLAVDLFGHYPPDERTKEEAEIYSDSLSASEVGPALHYLAKLAEKVGIDVPLTPTQADDPELAGLIEIIERTLAVSQAAITRMRLVETPPSVLIQPRLNHVGFLDFHRSKAIIEIGRDATIQKLPEIKAAFL